MAPYTILPTVLLLFIFALARLSVSAASSANQNACKATRYTSVCEATLLQNNTLPKNPTANDFICATIGSSLTDLKTMKGKAQSILKASMGKDLNMTNAAQNCLIFLGLSEKRLTMAGKSIWKSGLADARAWGSAALLYQYDCWSALKYVNSTNQVADAMSFVLRITNVTSNAVSMIASLQRYGKDTSLWAPPQTEREGQWGPAPSASDTSLISSQTTVPSDLKPDAYVCPTACTYRSIQAAVDAAPDHSKRRHVIYIKQGTYAEKVRVPFEKTNLVLLGEGVGKTVITGDSSAGAPGVSTYNTATVGVSGDGFMARDMTIRNTAGPVANQAVAFVSDSDHSVVESVEFTGHQDTLYAHSLRQLYRSCSVSGTVDFIFGNSAAVFLGCEIYVVPRQVDPEKGESNPVTAHGRTDPAQSTGFVFDRCSVNGSVDYWKVYSKNPAVHKAFLGRPWKEYSRTVFINCSLEKIVRPEGWLAWSGDFALSTLYYGEYRNEGAGAAVEERVPWSSQVPEEHLDVYSMRNFIQTSGV